MSVADRLKEERERLALTQTEMGLLISRGKTTIINWEKSVGSPDAVQLFELSQHGFDVTYITTGRRMVMSQEAPSYLSDKERELLANYQSADEDGKLAMEITSAALAKQKNKGGV